MRYAATIGRVGALAVTLGVGWAIASTAGVAAADSSESTGPSGSSAAATGPASGDGGAVGGADADGTDAPDAGVADAADEEAADQEAADEEAADEEAAEAEDAGADAAADSAADAPADDGEDSEDGDVADDGEDAGTDVDGSGDAAGDAGRQRDSGDDADSVRDATPVPQTTVAVVSPATPPPAPPQPTPAAPLVGSTMLASMAAVRERSDRLTYRSTAAIQVAAHTPNVLVIGVDGTNLSRILADPANVNFFSLMRTGTTAASTIVGHTTISNPSWSSILTGAWGEKTGVINNVFTPWTYSAWPTVFTQLESLDPDIETTSIANWNVISAIVNTGTGVDNLYNVAQQDDDPRWLRTDDAVGDLTEAAIAAASADVANLVFSYFVGVDENGHLFGGGLPEYAEALRNVDRNLGEIMAAVDAWEIATGEQWTVIVTTDHGHQPQRGFGHGFQSPDETSTFVIANNPDLFTEGGVNLAYSIIDVTPTLMDLFGFDAAPDSDGVSLTDLDDSTVTPADNDTALRTALLDVIAQYGYPDIGTNIALSIRTIAATIPYYVDNIVNGIIAGLQSLADSDIILVSPLAALAVIPVAIIGDIAYVAVNIVAQIVARLTGVTGASIFPLERPDPPSFPDSPEEATTPDLVAVACTGGRVTSAVFACGPASLAV